MADHPAAARLPVLLADVGTAADAAGRPLPPYRARLPGLRPQRRARPGRLRLHLRSPGRDHRALHRAARPRPLHPVHAGLRRPGRIPAGDRAPRSGAGDDRAERGRPRRRPRPAVGHPPRFWADRAAPRGSAARESSRPPRPGSATSAAARSRSSTTRTYGQTSSRFSGGPASTDPNRFVLRLPHQRRRLSGLAGFGCARTSHAPLLSGENTTRPFRSPRLRPIAATYPRRSPSD